MRNSMFKAISPWFSQRRYSCLLAGLSVTAGLVGASLLPAIATNAQSAPRVQATKQVLPDGVYLYGQSTQPDQVGQGYFVFEAKQGTVVGALYMPRSSFDCTSGKFQSDQLALTVVNSYDRTTNPYDIALERTSNVAAEGNPAFQNVGLQGFQRLSKLSDNDRRMLTVCKADFQKQAQK